MRHQDPSGMARCDALQSTTLGNTKSDGMDVGRARRESERAREREEERRVSSDSCFISGCMDGALWRAGGGGIRATELRNCSCFEANADGRTDRMPGGGRCDAILRGLETSKREGQSWHTG